MPDSNQISIFAVEGEEPARSDPMCSRTVLPMDSRRAINVSDAKCAPVNASFVMKASRLFTGILALLAVLSGAALLAVGAIPLLKEGSVNTAIGQVRGLEAKMVPPFAAAALILAGISFISLQALLRPAPVELLKRFLLGLAFVLWGITALMPSGAFTTELGNLVIALYVADLALIIRGDLKRDTEAGD